MRMHRQFASRAAVGAPAVGTAGGARPDRLADAETIGAPGGPRRAGAKAVFFGLRSN